MPESPEAQEYGGVIPATLEALRNVDHAAAPQVGDTLVVTAVDEDGTVHWAAGSSGAGGGGGFSDVIQISFDGTQTTLPDGAALFILLDPTYAGGLLYRNLGPAFTWNGDEPTRITVAADGIYTAHGVATIGGGTTEAQAAILIAVNGDQKPATLAQQLEIGAGVPDVGTGGSLYRYEMSAGDYFELTVGATGAADCSLLLAQLVVLREG